MTRGFTTFIVIAMGAPRISIGMPIYNEEKHLAAALESLLAQQGADFEIIVCDNASTDRSPEIAREFAARDPRVRYLRSETHVGAAENFEKPIDLATGEYFMWAAGHDLWDPTFLAKTSAVLDADPRVGLVYPRTRWIDGEGKVVRDVSDGLGTEGLGSVARVNTILWRTVKCTAVYGLIRRSVLKRTRLRQAFAADLILLAELATYSVFVELPEPLFLRRMNRATEDRASQTRRIHESIALRRKTRYAFPFFELIGHYYAMLAGLDVSPATKVVLLASASLALPVRYHQDLLGEVAQLSPGFIRRKIEQRGG